MKLSLNKETISRLTDDELTKINGGEQWLTSRLLCFTLIPYDTCQCTESCVAPICFPLPSQPNCNPQ
jgi:hypothetical protein